MGIIQPRICPTSACAFPSINHPVLSTAQVAWMNKMFKMSLSEAPTVHVNNKYAEYSHHVKCQVTYAG